MKNLNYDLRQLCTRNRDGSFATQDKRMRTLQNVANSLHDLGYRKMRAQSLKPKHIDALVEHFKDKELSPGTIKNNMTCLRWWAQKVGKPAVVARDNDHYGIERRVFVTNTSKAQELDQDKLGRIKDPYVSMSVELQSAFGLRREEAIKFQPDYAMKTIDDGYIQLKDTWTKGGKARNVPISDGLKDRQLELLHKASELAGKGSLIPSNKSYVDQLRAYERHTRNAGMSKLHGLRHQYAQNRYEHLTGMKCRANGGVSPKSMTPAQRKVDDTARRMISKELGHERKQIVAIYLGG